jgi:ATP-dependent RNA helicase RhlE
VNFNQFSFDPRIHASIKRIGFTDPTPIQQQAIPAVLEGDDVLGLAQTGTGKTAAFMLPILERLTRGPLRRVRALILAPTRELAEQIHQATVDFSLNMKVHSVAIYGGVSKEPQIKALRRGAEIVVACPGRLLDLMGDGQIDLTHVEVFVLDEADRMCDMGFLPDVSRIVKQLPERRQSLFFSATMPKDARKLAETILRNPVTVQIGMTAPAKTVSHALYPVHHRSKKKLLMELLDQTATGRVLIFTRTKYRARNLARDLGRKGFRVAALQGNMSQNQRQRAMDGFRKGKFDLLVATDIAARGIDVTEISHVINFDMPDTVDAYTHRIGRTGRAQEKGEAFTFVTPDDTPMVRSIEQLLGYRISRRQLDGSEHQEFEAKNPTVQVGSKGVHRWAMTPNDTRNSQRSQSKRNRQSGSKGNGHSQPR